MTTPTVSTLAIQLSKYDNGELEWEEFLELFQTLVDTGLAWTLQGSIGRTAASLIEAGEIQPPRGDEEERDG